MVGRPTGSLARHSTITLTMDRYTHLHNNDLAAALETLPDLSEPVRLVASATGTDNISAVAYSVSSSLSPNSTVQRNAAHFGAINCAIGEDAGSTTKQAKNTDLGIPGGGTRTRTAISGQRILSP
jgi:hypothetical protein